MHLRVDRTNELVGIGSVDRKIVTPSRKPPSEYGERPDEVGRVGLSDLMSATLRAKQSGFLAACSWYIWGWARRVVLFLYTIDGLFCDREAFEVRENICLSCDVLVHRDGGWRFCGSCGCWEWILAHLGIKNWFRRHECPKRKHPPLIEISPKEQQRWRLSSLQDVHRRSRK